VGAKAVVTKKFTEEYTAIGGNPAKVIATNVDWDREFLEQQE
jgi:serine acetyltransferase